MIGVENDLLGPVLGEALLIAVGHGTGGYGDVGNLGVKETQQNVVVVDPAVARSVPVLDTGVVGTVLVDDVVWAAEYLLYNVRQAAGCSLDTLLGWGSGKDELRGGEFVIISRSR